MSKTRKNLRKRFGRIGILMGGDSPEREISLKSGTAVYQALKEEGAEGVIINIKNTKNKPQLKMDILNRHLDVAFIAMHGDFGEDGQLQAILKELDIPYTGSGPQASRLAMDKIASRRIFEFNKLAVPKFIIAKNKNFNCDGLNFPLVVKPSNLGSSIGLSIVRNKREMEHAFLFARKYSRKIIVEEYQPGEEITVGILEEQALPVIMLKPKEEFYNYKAKYTKGLTRYLIPAPLKTKIAVFCQAAALKAHRVLGLWHFSRVDMILRDGKQPIILEVNSIPGLTPLSLLPKAAENKGLNFIALCIKLVESAFK